MYSQNRIARFRNLSTLLLYEIGRSFRLLDTVAKLIIRLIVIVAHFIVIIMFSYTCISRLAPVLKTVFHQCVIMISYTEPKL